MISVLLPVYNGAEFIEGCIQGVLGQTDPDLELVVVDDGSTDRTPQLVAAWAARDSRVQLYRLDRNSRKNGAYRRAIELARGGWVMEVNADDVLLPRAVEVLTRAAERHPSALAVFANHDVVDIDGELDEERSEEADIRSGRRELVTGFVDDILSRQLMHNVLTTSVSTLIRRETLQGFPDFTDSMTDYWASWLIARRGRVYYVDEVVAHYRRYEGSESTSPAYYSVPQARARLRMYLAISARLRHPRLLLFMAGRIARTLVLLTWGGRYSPRRRSRAAR